MRKKNTEMVFMFIYKWIIFIKKIGLWPIMFKISLIIALMAAIYCLCAAIAALFAASRENELPDIEDVEIDEIIAL